MITSSKIEQRPDAVALGAQPSRNPGLRGDHAHVGGDRLDDHAADILVELGHDVVRDHHRLGPHRPERQPCPADRASPRRCLRGEQRVGGAVEVAVKITMRSRPVYPRARRTAVLVASVPSS